MQDTAYEVTASSFSIAANDQTYPARIDWDGSRYVVEVPSLKTELFVEQEADGRELISYINEEQALRVVPANASAIYSHGHFFKPVLPLSGAAAFQLLDLLHPATALGTATSEKGTAIVGDDWEATSVFGLISALDPGSPRAAPPEMAAHLSSPDLLVCTDMGTEIADFMATEGDRVVFIHAKASSRERKYSASGLHDVASQAIKNLPYLQPLEENRPRGARWTQPWRSRGVSGTATRQRVGAYTSSDEIWRHVRTVIANPSAQREVWLILGRSLSVQALKDEGRRRPPAAEAIQVYSLLQTTWGAVSQLGARLRVFCSP